MLSGLKTVEMGLKAIEILAKTDPKTSKDTRKSMEFNELQPEFILKRKVASGVGPLAVYLKGIQ